MRDLKMELKKLSSDKARLFISVVIFNMEHLLTECFSTIFTVKAYGQDCE